MNINPAVNLKIKGFGGATISNKESGIFNGMVDEQGVTQRPSIEIQEQAANARGRAIYYWDTNSTLYILNDDTIYKNSYSGGLGTTITAGTKKCKFLSLGGRLILLDHADNAGYTITTGDTVAAITGFPSSLVPGGAILNGYLYVMGADGTIYNSNLDTPQTFTAGNNTNAEREEDGGAYLGKHHDHIVAFGERTIEFFYDNANPTNSPLNRREDISYNVGCANGESVWEDGDLTIFIGNDLNSGLGVYALTQFSLKKISNSDLDALITKALTVDGYGVIGEGVSAQGHKFYTLTFYTTQTDIVTENTFVYDFNSNTWGEWETTVGGLSDFPIMGTTIRSSASIRYMEGIFTNGDIFIVNNSLSPQDAIAGSVYVNAGYVVNDYIVETDSSAEDIVFKIRFGQLDGDSHIFKYMDIFRIIANKTNNSQDVTVYISDDNNLNFESVGTINLNYTDDQLTELGRFKRRNIEIQHSSTEQVWIETTEAIIRGGSR